MPTRRDVLRGVGAAAIGATASAGVVSATHATRKPGHVTITFEPDTLAKYQPLLEISQKSREKLNGLYGWVARSSELDTAVCVYWCSYTHQESPWWAPSTGHFGDHEPVQVEFNPSTETVVRVRASIYHWIKGEVTGSEATLSGTNPTLSVLDPYHHYTVQPDDSVTTKLSVKDLTKEFDGWLDNGLEENLVPGACYNPWTMESESDFWAEGQFGLPSNESVRTGVAKRLGYGVVGSLEA